MFTNYRNRKDSITSTLHPKEKQLKSHIIKDQLSEQQYVPQEEWLIYSRELKHNWLLTPCSQGIIISQCMSGLSIMIVRYLRCKMTQNKMASKGFDIQYGPCQKSGSIHERIQSFNLALGDYYSGLIWINKVSNTKSQTIIQISIRFTRYPRGISVQHCAKLMLQQNLHTSAKHSYSSTQLHH